MLGLAVRLALFAIAQPWTEQGEARLLSGSADIRSYHYLAHDLVLYGRYGGNPVADASNLDPAIRPLGYALFVAFWYRIFEPQIWYALLAQIALSTISIVLVYSITRREFSNRAARVATLLFALYPNGVLFACTLMTETLYIFTTLVFLEAWSRFRKNLTDVPRAVIAYGALLGFLFGLSVYVRVATVYLALLIPFALWFGHGSLSKVGRLWLIASFFSTLLLTVIPYSLYMYQRYGTFRMTIVDDYNLLVNTVGHALGGREGRIDPEAIAFKLQIVTEAEERMRSDGVDPIVSNPFLRGFYYRQVALEYIRRYPYEML